MASHEEEPSPLIAALPPETDYMTYLTLLEYQLTSSNLPTLTRLLSNDDGTLAKEIGWDLLKLVLPLSEEVPEEAGKCLEIVARRGNPKEVVVQVTVELETLCQEDDGEGFSDDQDFEGHGGKHELHAFPGEAEPIHLGSMTLEGMPSSSTQKSGEATLDPNEEERARRSDSPTTNATKFRILLSMLSTLHSRIQTLHPSRFLATSLPAAFGSYRRLPIDSATTAAFVFLIGKLSGKQRPALPPRASISDTAEVQPNITTGTEPQLASLPDPEAQSETTSPGTVSAGEAAIIKRLLQAVLLEVLEEYVLSLATHEPPSMSWTARLREIHEPEKIVPRRKTEVDKWKTDPSLQERDTLIHKFVTISHDLGIDLEEICQQMPTLETTPTAAADNNAGSPAEYPTSPEQIPIPKIGAFLLLVARHLAPMLTTPQQTFCDLNAHQHNALHLASELTGIGHEATHPALLSLPIPILDSLIATLYYAAQYNDIPQASPPPLSSSETTFHLLTELCSSNPNPDIRDSAHATAAIIFHRYPPATRLRLLKHILTASHSPPTLRAVAVDWLKDDIARGKSISSSSSSASNLPPEILTTDTELAAALYTPPRTDDTDSNDLVVQLPFRVAVLNLLTVCPTEPGDWLIRALTKVRSSLDNDDDDNEDEDEEAQQHQHQHQQHYFISPIDLWCFDDALQRAKDAFARQDPAARPRWEGKDEWLRTHPDG